MRGTVSPHLICIHLCSFVFICVFCLSSPAQAPPKVTIKDGKALMDARVMPVDPTPRAQAAHSGDFSFGIKVENQRITFGEQESIWCHVRVDGQDFQLGFFPGGALGRFQLRH